MTPDIQRQTEIFLCQQMQAAMAPIEPTLRFLPFLGFELNPDPLEPPFSVISISNPDKTMATEGTWQAAGTLQLLAHIDEMASEAYSDLKQAVYAALNAIAPATLDDFTFHGLDISGMRSAQDKDNKAHADIIEFACGVSGPR